MRTTLIIVVLLSLILYILASRYTVRSTVQTDGAKQYFVVDTSTGKSWQIR